MRILIITILAITASFTAFCQKLDTTKLFDLERLSKQTVNTSYHEGAPMITPDGKTLYFFVTNHPQNKAGKDGSQDVWFSTLKSDGKWAKALRMDGTINRAKSNQVMAVVNDGKTLILDDTKGKKKGLAYSDLKNGKWTKPQSLEVEGYTKMSVGDFSGANMSNDMKVALLYFSETAGSAKSDLYVSFQTGPHSYSKPKALGLNTTKDEFGPYLCADNKTMYFASDRPGGFGLADIYVTQRLDSTWLNWSKPKNIGKPVNTKGFDAYFSMDETMENAYTTRAYMSQDGGSLDILALSLCPEIKLEGIVKDFYTKKPLQGWVEINIEEVGQMTLDCNEKGEYSAILKDNGVYIYSVHADRYHESHDTLDLSDVKRKKTIKKDFLLKPVLPEVILSGHVYDKHTNEPLSSKISLTTKWFDELRVKSTSSHGFYKKKLPNIGKYLVTIKREGYYDFTEEFTIEEEAEMDMYNIERDFHLIPLVKDIKIAGTLTNEKDGAPVQGTINFRSLSGKEVVANTTEEGTYEIVLPEPGHYDITSINESFLAYTGEIEVEMPETNEPTQKDIALTPIEIGATVRLNKVYFDFDKATLRPESFPELDRVVTLMENNPTLEIEISGHTDDKGSDAYNLKLSQNRANSVKKYVVSKGISSSKIIAKGYGESQPEVANDSDENRQFNRRVQFTVLKK